MFQPLGAELNLHATTGRLQLSGKKRLVMNNRLARLLAFARDTFEHGKTYTTDEPHSLTVHRKICVHLGEVSSSDNLHNGCPSTLLRYVPVKNEPCGAVGQRLSVLQYKRLVSGPISQLTLSVKDSSGKGLDFDYISTTLDIRERYG